MAEFLLGINYWPRSSAMYMWDRDRFDRGEIDEELARIAHLGLEIVRFFLLWEAFQPDPRTIDPDALERLDWLIERIAAHRLRAMPTFFTGHMSGVNWLPAWTLDRSTPAGRFRTISGGREQPYGIGDFYRGELLDAQRRHVRAVGERYRGHPAIFAWDLGNEFSNMREPRAPADAAGWSTILANDLHETSEIAVTAGTHSEDITRDRHLRPSSLCAPFAFATMHGYSVYSAFARGRLDPDVVPFLSAITHSCARTPVLFSEFGNPTCPPGTVSPFERVPLPGEPAPPPTPAAEAGAPLAPFACLRETEMADYARAVLERLQAQGALGALWWCWADYATALAQLPPFDRAPHELTFGVVRNDGSEKPVAGVLAGFAASRPRRSENPPPTLVDEAAYYAGLPDVVQPTYDAYLQSKAVRG